MTRAGIATSSAYLNSPVYIVDETNQPFRWRAGEPTRGMELLDELEAEGTTDYLIQPLPFQDTTRTAAMSFATQVPGAFDDLASAILSRPQPPIPPSPGRSRLERRTRGER